MNFQILTVLWGEPYKTWFIKATMKSLAFESNYKVINKHCTKWNIFCDDDQMDEIREVGQVLFPHVMFKVKSTKELRAFIDQHQAAMCWQIDQCLKDKERLLFAPPDTVFANHSLESFLHIGREPKTCVAVAHPRVLPDIIEEIGSAKEPHEMVGLSWKYLHQSWADAEAGHPRQNSFIGGVRWEALRAGTYSVTHHLPTVYFADFTEEDLMYFKTVPGFGHYDHAWPSDVLLRQCRQRYVGSSEAAFIAEITHKEKNIPPVEKDGDKDSFWRNNPHNLQNRMTQVIFSEGT